MAAEPRPGPLGAQPPVDGDEPYRPSCQALHPIAKLHARLARSRREEALDLLDRLPVHQAVAVFISDYHGEDTPEIAAAWGKNKSTVYSWIKQGRAALAKELRRDAVDDDDVKKRQP